MKMPNGHFADVPNEKLFGYLLNASHPDNPGHAELFNTLLGINASNAKILKDALLEAAANQDAIPGKPSPFGSKYEIRFQMTGPKRTCTIVSIWIVEKDQMQPRLVTAFIE